MLTVHTIQKPPDRVEWVALPMRDFGDAIDLYIGHLALKRRSPRTRTRYHAELVKAANAVAPLEPWEIETDDLRRYLRRWENAQPATMASQISILKGFFGWLLKEGALQIDPTARIDRPSMPAPHERKTTVISGDDVVKMLAACRDWQEMLCLGTLAYCGPRRRALSNARWRDVDMDRGTIDFFEKGAKSITKPIPNELREVYRLFIAEQQPSPDDYVVPNLHPSKVRRTDTRSDKIIWMTVKRVAARASVKSHVHALRHAFAVHYLEANPGCVENLQQLLGHSNIETTMGYLRNANRDKQKETVRSLSWGNVAADRPVPPGGVGASHPRAGTESAASVPDIMSGLAAARRAAFPAESDPLDIAELSIPEPKGLNRLLPAKPEAERRRSKNDDGDEFGWYE